MEYQILSGQPADCQKTLNQWRHQFNLVIISMTSRNDQIIILLTREKKA